MPQALIFFFAFVVVLALIGAAAWLVRRFAGNRLGANTNRGRMPRLAVIDAAAVDGRRRLVLVRRDNVEHLLMIGGPTDIVVEPNIVRAMPGTRSGPAAAQSSAAPNCRRGSRRCPMPAAGPTAMPRAESSGTAMPEPPPRPSRPSFADEVRRPAPALSERRSDPVGRFHAEPMSRTDIREPAPPRAAAARSEPIIPRPSRPIEPPKPPPVRAPERAAAPPPPPLARRFRRPIRISPRWRSGSKPHFAARPAIRPSPCRRAAGGTRAAAEPAAPRS